MKKILILGGKPIGSVELVKRLKQRGIYTIVTDYLSIDESPAKRISDESWDISTADIDRLSEKIRRENINGVMTGVHEFNINRMVDLSELCSIPCYCNRTTWKYCDNKMAFKDLCKKNGINVANTYTLLNIKTLSKENYPLIVKPVDGSGSRGFHICDSEEDVYTYFEKAKSHSQSGSVLIEEFVPYNSVIIHYTMINGKCIYSGMSDKISVRFKTTGASVMGIQTFPSIGEKTYLNNLNKKVVKMFEEAGFENGPIWIESFYDGKDKFIFNEMGYRFGGSLTYFPVKYFTGIDQLDLMIDNALGISTEQIKPIDKDNLKKYCIIPIHIKSGKIKHIKIGDAIRNNRDYLAIVPVHFEGDIIQEWGSAQQVYAYIHILFSDKNDLVAKVNSILKNIQVISENGIQMLYILFDINTISV